MEQTFVVLLPPLDTGHQSKLQTGEETASLKTVRRKWDVHVQKNEMGPLTIPLHKNIIPDKSDFNLKHEMLELQGENVGSTLQDVSVGKNFLNRTLFAWELRPTSDKWTSSN